jgi:hypothetical protein
MKSIHLVLLAILVAPMTALAERPATQPSRPFAGKAEGGYAKMPKRDGFMPGMRPTTQELEEAMSFVEKNSPNHFNLFNRLPEGSPRRARAEQLMVMRYHNLMRVKEQNPEVYDAMLQQWKLEDEAVGYARAMKEHTQPEANVRLREVVRRMVQMSLDQRRERIDRLRKALDEQQKQLEQDEQDKDKLMEQQAREAVNKFERLFGGKDHGADAPEPAEGGGVNALTK